MYIKRERSGGPGEGRAGGQAGARGHPGAGGGDGEALITIYDY